MSLKSYGDLNEVHFDVLKEICNIGCGNAATSLSTMFGISIDIEIPEIGIVDYDESMEKLGGADTVASGIMLFLTGEINGMLMFLFSTEFAATLLKTLMGVEITDFSEIDEIGFSAIHETANIAAGSFITAISGFTGLVIDISTPVSTVDMIGAIMNVPAVYCANISDKILFLENRFVLDGKESQAHILLNPDIESLERLITKLGIEA